MEMNPSDGNGLFPFMGARSPKEPDVREVIFTQPSKDDIDFIVETVETLQRSGRVISSVSWRGRRIVVIHTRDMQPESDDVSLCEEDAFTLQEAISALFGEI